jgi:hypothetical protein
MSNNRKAICQSVGSDQLPTREQCGQNLCVKGNSMSQGFLFLSGTSVSITSKYLLLLLFHEAKWMAYTF